MKKVMPKKKLEYFLWNNHSFNISFNDSYNKDYFELRVLTGEMKTQKGMYRTSVVAKSENVQELIDYVETLDISHHRIWVNRYTIIKYDDDTVTPILKENDCEYIFFSRTEAYRKAEELEGDKDVILDTKTIKHWLYEFIEELENQH